MATPARNRAAGTNALDGTAPTDESIAMRGREDTLPNGPAAAAILASGIGCMAMGFFTTFAVILPSLNAALNLYNPAGPLSGKTTGAVLVWLLAWAVLHVLWRNTQVDFGRVFMVTMVLIVLGLVGTFPPFFEAFAH